MLGAPSKPHYLLAGAAGLALAALLGACGSAPKAPDNARLAQAAEFNRRGEVALEREDYRRALAQYEAALAVDVSIEYADGIAINSINLARVHQLLGQTALAQKRLDALLSADVPIAPAYLTAARLRQAMLYQASGDAAAAARALAQAEESCKDEACAWRGTLLNLRAGLALGNDDLAAAASLAAEALAINRKREAREESANSLRLQGAVSLKKREFAAALAPLGEALELDKTLGLSERIEQDLRGLADAREGLGEAKQAAALRARAAQVASKTLAPGKRLATE